MAKKLSAQALVRVVHEASVDEGIAIPKLKLQLWAVKYDGKLTIFDVENNIATYIEEINDTLLPGTGQERRQHIEEIVLTAYQGYPIDTEGSAWKTVEGILGNSYTGGRGVKKAERAQKWLEIVEELKKRAQEEGAQDYSLLENPSTRHQFINQIIYEEYFYCKPQYCWAEKAKMKLRRYGICLSENTLKSYMAQLKNSKRCAIASSSFDGRLGSRTGKQCMYEAVDTAVDFFLKNNSPKYVGLPANQLLHVIRKYNNRVVACESDEKMFKFMKDMKDCFAPKSEAMIHNKDIFSYLKNTDKKFSLFDFDLMQNLNTNSVHRLSNSIVETAENTAIVNIVSCIGRGITKEEYKEIMPHLLKKDLKKCGYNVIHNRSGGYRDRNIPMKYELLVINKESRK